MRAWNDESETSRRRRNARLSQSQILRNGQLSRYIDQYMGSVHPLLYSMPTVGMLFPYHCSPTPRIRPTSSCIHHHLMRSRILTGKMNTVMVVLVGFSTLRTPSIGSMTLPRYQFQWIKIAEGFSSSVRKQCSTGRRFC